MNPWVIVALVCGSLLGWLSGRVPLKLQQTYDSVTIKVTGIIFVVIVNSVFRAAMVIGLLWIFRGRQPDLWIIATFFIAVHGVAALRRILHTSMWGDYRPC